MKEKRQDNGKRCCCWRCRTLTGQCDIRLDDALDLKEALEVCDLEDADKEKNARLEQRPPYHTRVGALGS